LLQHTNQFWVGSDLSDLDFASLAERTLAQDDIALLPNLLVVADRHADLWPTEHGQSVLAGILNLLLDTLNAGDVAGAIAALAPCPPALARRAHDLLASALCPDEPADLLELDDAAIFCFALLLGAGGRSEEVAPFLDRAAQGRIESWFRPPATLIADHFAPPAAQIEPFKLKLVIWDLDDTLWHGTLADGDDPVLIAERAEFVRAFNRHGVVSAICSKNDRDAARAKLEAMGMWDDFVFPRIAFVPKGAVIRQMIADMQLRPQNVLFVDDNPHNLHEVADAVPGIRTVDATTPECDALLARLLADNAHVEKCRIADYRLLEAKLSEREDNPLSDEAFLIQSGIHATFTHRMDNLEFADRIEELINRSNQLNYTQSRAAPGSIRARIFDLDNYEVVSAFVWDKYGYYGLVGVAVLNFRTRVLEHFAFSCRIMHMGVEDFMIRLLAEWGHRVDAGQFRKPLPPQSSRAIITAYYCEPAVRERILAAEAPRDWTKVRLRLMADCQSAAFFHYSRFQDEADYDNAPRLFSLPMMLNGEADAQVFPPFLAYTAATDYADWRWDRRSRGVDIDAFTRAVDLFARRIVDGGHKCLIFLPPQDLPEEMYNLHIGCDARRSRETHPILNDLWRAAVARHPDHFDLIALGDMLTGEDLVHAHHYVPSALRRIAGVIDDWYATQQPA
jgi:FkbH-like protein